MRLAGQHIVVTGGRWGIGLATVGKALAEGACVTSPDLGVGPDLGPRSLSLLADVTRAADIARACAEAVDRFGPVTGLVNNAGKNVYADPVTMTEAEWDDVFSVDLKAAWLMARAVLPGMIVARKGAIVNVASVHADMTYPGMFPYAAAKSGLVGLTRSLALEVGPQQIRVNALSPGYTETFLVQEFFERGDPALRDSVLKAHAMGRMAKPSEIANCIVFLLGTSKNCPDLCAAVS